MTLSSSASWRWSTSASEISQKMTSIWPTHSEVPAAGQRSQFRGVLGHRRSLLLCAGSIYGFNVAASRPMEQLAAKKGVPLRLHRVIYKLIDQLKDELSSKLPPLVSENIIGESSRMLKMMMLCLMTSLTSPVVRPVQARPPCWQCFTSRLGKKKFLWPAAVFRKVSWTASSSSG